MLVQTYGRMWADHNCKRFALPLSVSVRRYWILRLPLVSILTPGPGVGNWAAGKNRRSCLAIRASISCVKVSAQECVATRMNAATVEFQEPRGGSCGVDEGLGA